MRGSGNRSEAVKPISTAPWLERLQELKLELPLAPTPLGSYSGAAETKGLLFLSGMLPLLHGKLARKGRIGEDLSIGDGQEAAAYAALNGLATARDYLRDASRLERVLRVSVSMVAEPAFTKHAEVADGASEILERIFPGTPGHTRLAFGVESLPMGAPVVVELLFALRE